MMKKEKHEEDDQLVEVHSLALQLYRDNEFWRRETSLSDVKQWSMAELRQWIEACIQRTAPKPELQTVVQKVLRLMEEEDIGGELLLAGGKSYLVEKTSLVGMSKADRMRLPIVVELIFSAVQEAESLHGNISYWNRLERSSAMGQALCHEYKTTGSKTGALLRLAMEPYPLDVILFSSICHLETAANVVEADEYVDKIVNPASPCLFKVVSMAPRDDQVTIWSNLIYARSDLDLLKQQNDQDDDPEPNNEPTCSRRQRRKERHGKRQFPHWELLASVDFAQHGSAMPGHWHLNATSRGDMLPHLQLSAGCNIETWHGGEDSCPLWWHFIPSGMAYKNPPHRLRILFTEMNTGKTGTKMSETSICQSLYL